MCVVPLTLYRSGLRGLAHKVPGKCHHLHEMSALFEGKKLMDGFVDLVFVHLYRILSVHLYICKFSL